MSLFGGEDAVDKRDFGFAYAGFKGSIYLATVLATKGLLNGGEAIQLGEMIRHGIAIIPRSQLTDDGRATIEAMLDDILAIANANVRATERLDSEGREALQDRIAEGNEEELARLRDAKGKPDQYGRYRRRDFDSDGNVIGSQGAGQ